MTDSTYNNENAGKKTGGSFALDGAMLTLAMMVTFISGYTTLRGMLRIFNFNEFDISTVEGFFSVSAAAALTLVVQIALTVLCWVLGKDFARAITAKMHDFSARQTTGAKTGRFVTMGLMIVICLAISVFFSFNTYFNNLYKGNEEERSAKNAVPTFTIETRSLLIQSISDFRNKRRNEILKIATDSEFLPGIVKLKKIAESEQDTLNSRIAELSLKRRNAKLEEIKEKIKAKAKVAEKQRTAKESQIRIGAIDNEIKPLEQTIAQMRTEITEFEKTEKKHLGEAKAQELGLEGRTKGKGSEYHNALADAKAASINALAHKNRILSANDQIGKLRAERTNLQIFIEQKKLLEGVSPDDSTDTSQATVTSKTAQDIEILRSAGEAMVALDNKLSRFEELPTPSALSELRGVCNDIHGALSSDSTLAAKVSDMNCDTDSTALGRETTILSTQINKMNTFTNQCGNLDDGDFEPVAAVTALRDCYTLALKVGIPLNQSTLSRAEAKINSFATRFDPTQHEFLKTLQAFSVSKSLAVLALFFAAVQDLAVFIMTFIVEFFRRERTLSREEELGRMLDEGEENAFRFILANSDPIPGSKDQHIFRFAQEVQASMDENKVMNIKKILNEFIDRDLAEAVVANEYNIASRGMGALTNQLKRSNQQTQHRAANRVHSDEKPQAQEEDSQNGHQSEASVSSQYLSPAEKARRMRSSQNQTPAQMKATPVSRRSKRVRKTESDNIQQGANNNPADSPSDLRNRRPQEHVSSPQHINPSPVNNPDSISRQEQEKREEDHEQETNAATKIIRTKRDNSENKQKQDDMDNQEETLADILKMINPK